jgi:hypothetical protein
MSTALDLLDEVQDGYADLEVGHTDLPAGGPILAAALAYRRRGWSIIPIAAGTKVPPKRFSWKQYQARQPTERELRDWFADRDDLGLAVLFGEASGGLVCRDFDDVKGYERWKRAYPDLARVLPTVATARGRHVYFRVQSSWHVFRDLRPEENGEFRGDSGHYCLLPPSRHPDGPEYRWLVPLPKDDLLLIEAVVDAGLLPDAGQYFCSGVDVTQKAQGSHRKSQVIISPVRARGEAVRMSLGAQMGIEEAIARTIPTGPGTRRMKLLELARKLKFMPELASIPAAGINFLKPYLKRWWKKAKPRTSGNHPEFHQSWQDFVFAWEEARIPYGATTQAIFEKARSSPAPKVAVEKYGEGSLRAILASLCRELQRSNGGDHFFLSGRTAGSLLKVSDVQAWRWLKQLQEDRIIEPVKVHPRGRRLAMEYRYLGD